ncbi:MAG: C-type lectin domain-containing protein [Candidatus Poribacteria bacterium]
MPPTGSPSTASRPSSVMPVLLIIVGLLSLGLAGAACRRGAHTRVNRLAGRRAAEAHSPRLARAYAPMSAWIVNPATGHEYAVVDAGTWPQAAAAASRAGGHLGTINSADEQAWLVEQFGASPRYWIGLTDAAGEGKWRWVTGEALAYTNWAAGEPNDFGSGDEDYAHMGAQPHGVWNDLGPDSTMWRGLTRAIVERPERVIHSIGRNEPRPGLRLEAIGLTSEAARSQELRASVLLRGHRRRDTDRPADADGQVAGADARPNGVG